jgi:GTPase SAR1 family protein
MAPHRDTWRHVAPQLQSNGLRCNLLKKILLLKNNLTTIKVGTKIDLRNDPSEIEKLHKKKEKVITYEDGVKFAKKIKAVKYVKKNYFLYKIY